MNVTEYKALQINKIIKESDVYKQYRLVKDKITSKYINKEDELKLLQQELVNIAYESNDEVYQEKMNKYLIAKEQFDKDPLIVKYIDAYRDLQQVILGVKNIIESGV